MQISPSKMTDREQLLMIHKDVQLIKSELRSQLSSSVNVNTELSTNEITSKVSDQAYIFFYHFVPY